MNTAILDDGTTIGNIDRDAPVVRFSPEPGIVCDFLKPITEGSTVWGIVYDVGAGYMPAYGEFGCKDGYETVEDMYSGHTYRFHMEIDRRWPKCMLFHVDG